MLDLPRYLLGVGELLILAGASVFAASGIRARLLPDFNGAPSHLATTVLAAALIIWPAELLGTFALFSPAAYVGLVSALGVAIGTYFRGWWRGGVGRGRPRPQSPPNAPDRARGRSAPAASVGTVEGRRASVLTVAVLLIAMAATLHFAADLRPKLTTGMTGFDSTWYHGPFAAGFFQSGDTWRLHFIAPQFLAWFYPANAEIFHAAGMLAFGRDILSPLLNMGWFLGCLLACWCIGRPFGVAPWSLALGALALSVPALSDQAGEARNDIVGTFFLLGAVAIALNAASVGSRGRAASGPGAILVVGLAAGLAAGTKLNFLLPAAVLLIGVAAMEDPGLRWRRFAIGFAATLAGGGYWYLRNLGHTGNPLPWFDRLGPLSLPSPDQPLGGREGHSVFGYIGNGSVWSEWLLPGLHQGLTALWPLLLAAALSGLLLCLSGRSAPLRVVGLVGLAAALSWLVAPTSASGPEGMPRGFESGLRYLVPALALGLVLLPAVPALRDRLADIGVLSSPLSRPGASSRLMSHFFPPSGKKCDIKRRGAVALALLALLSAIVIGYPVQRHYLQNRYASPEFSAPGLDAAFAWARSISGARIGTTTTRQYPLLGTDLSNRVDFVGEHRTHGGFVAPGACGAWRRLLNEGNYDYVVASRDRVEPGRSPYPASARWTEGSNARVVLREPPTVVFKLTGPLDPSACGG